MLLIELVKSLVDIMMKILASGLRVGKFKLLLKDLWMELNQIDQPRIKEEGLMDLVDLLHYPHPIMPHLPHKLIEKLIVMIVLSGQIIMA